jgi:hypothetical protein
MLEIKKSDVVSLLKQFNGHQVITVRDAHNLTGYNERNISYYVLNKLEQGRDYYSLCGLDLKKFKADNPSVPRNINAMYVITGGGFAKLARILNFTIA